MTHSEKQLIEAQRILDGAKCQRCGEYGPAIHYDAGVCWIECLSCGRSKAAPDFEIETLMNLWNTPNQ